MDQKCVCIYTLCVCYRDRLPNFHFLLSPSLISGRGKGTKEDEGDTCSGSASVWKTKKATEEEQKRKRRRNVEMIESKYDVVGNSLKENRLIFKLWE